MKIRPLTQLLIYRIIYHPTISPKHTTFLPSRGLCVEIFWIWTSDLLVFIFPGNISVELNNKNTFVQFDMIGGY